MILQAATRQSGEQAFVPAILFVEVCIRRLEQRDPDLGRIVRLRFFAGLSEEEVGAVLGVTDRTIRREWSLAKALLRRHLEGEPLDS